MERTRKVNGRTDGRTDRRTDRQTNRRTDGGHDIIRPVFDERIKMTFTGVTTFHRKSSNPNVTRSMSCTLSRKMTSFSVIISHDAESEAGSQPDNGQIVIVWVKVARG